MQAAASIALLLMSGWTQPGMAQQQTNPNPQTNPTTQPLPQTNPNAPAPPQTVVSDTTGQPGLPQAPAPKLTEPLYLRDTPVDYSKPKSHVWNPIAPYTATNVPSPVLVNTDRLKSLLQDGKIYLSLADAVALGLENNYDIAIARVNLDIADTDILRAKAGSTLRGVSTGLVQNTLGGTTLTLQGGAGPGATSAGLGGAGAGVGGIVLSTQGGGPTPEFRDPVLQGTVQYETLAQPQLNTLFSGGPAVVNSNTGTYYFTFTQGLLTGTQFTTGFNNTRVTTNNPFSNYSPSITTNFRATATQHFLQGVGRGVNGRSVLQARNTRRLTH